MLYFFIPEIVIFLFKELPCKRQVALLRLYFLFSISIMGNIILIAL